MNVLAFDTSNRALSVALANRDGVLGEVTTDEKLTHSVQLLPMISRLMTKHGWKPSDLQRVVVARGPGSYTGVRIGVTTAKTLAWTLGIELVGVSSLEALALNGKMFNGYVSPIFDARRGQVYTALFKSEHGQLVRASDDQILLASDWAASLAMLEEPVWIVGSDIPLHRDTFVSILQNQAMFAPESEWLPSAGEMALLGMTRVAENIHGFVPNYVRMAEAEANWVAAQKK